MARSPLPNRCREGSGETPLALANLVFFRQVVRSGFGSVQAESGPGEGLGLESRETVHKHTHTETYVYTYFFAYIYIYIYTYTLIFMCNPFPLILKRSPPP